MDLLADGVSLQASAAQVRETADALATAAGQVDARAADASDAAGHDHVRAGLDEFAAFHRTVLDLLAVAADAVATEITTFDECMAATDADLAAGC